MATGFTDSLSPIAAFIEWLQPASVLDVGVGHGRMGFLAREYGHQLWSPRSHSDGIVVDGIEGHAPYIGEIQRAIYDEIILGEALENLAALQEAGRRYELVIASDILEHFTEADGHALITFSLELAPSLVVATPFHWFAQSDDDNEFQTHRSHWTAGKLRAAGAAAILHQDLSIVVLFGDETANAYVAATKRPLSVRGRGLALRTRNKYWR